MPSPPVYLELNGAIAEIVLNDPARRNALNLAMFDGLDELIAKAAARDTIHVVLLRGESPAFCAGFDLAAAAHDPTSISTFIHRLSAVNRSLRRMPQVVVASVHGAAIAGGCAMLSACDFVIASATATLGYPVHRIGVSPAVTIPTLMQMIGGGAARALLMSGELVDGATAHRLGLATHLAPDDASTLHLARELALRLAVKPPHALRITKRWLNELDGSLTDAGFDQVRDASAAAAMTEEAAGMLAAWRQS